MKPILIDIFPEWMSGKGIFKTLDGIAETPWKDETDGAALDLEYYGNKSGSKIIAPLVEKLLNSEGLSDDKRIALANLIWLKFGTNWGKLWATLTVEYNPIENYSMVEDTTGNTSRNNTASRNNSASSSAATYAFNSTEAVDTDSSAQSGTESGTEAETGQHADHHTRSGNIGVTTSQQMLQSERDLWMWKFYEQVFADVDTILCIEVYGESCGDFSQYSGGGSYVLPPATASTLGGVKIGSGIDVTADGTISVNGVDVPVLSVNGKTGAVVLNYDDVGSPSLQEFQQIEDDVEDNTIMLNNHSTEISNNTGAIQNLYDRSPFRFGVDSEGNYGYYKAGADTLTPFKSGIGKVIATQDDFTIDTDSYIAFYSGNVINSTLSEFEYYSECSHSVLWPSTSGSITKHIDLSEFVGKHVCIHVKSNTNITTLRIMTSIQQLTQQPIHAQVIAYGRPDKSDVYISAKIVFPYLYTYCMPIGEETIEIILLD